MTMAVAVVSEVLRTSVIIVFAHIYGQRYSGLCDPEKRCRSREICITSLCLFLFSAHIMTICVDYTVIFSRPIPESLRESTNKLAHA